MKIDTKCVQEGYSPENGQARVLPIYQSTTFKYDSTEHVGKLFNLTEAGHFYSRLSNPTVECAEKKIAALEGGAAAVLTSSGQSATFMAIFNIATAGSHILSSSTIYGGTYNLLAVTMKKMGIEITFIDPCSNSSEIEKHIKPNTKAIFGETIANPALTVLDIEEFAKAAHKHNIPLIVDNTFATPINLRPIEYGADIIIHSTSKYLDGHAAVLGGCVVDSGKFNFNNEKFPEFINPDDSYHGVIYTKDFKDCPFAVKLRVQLMRDLGCMMSPNSAFLLNNNMETLHLRVKKHCENALAVAKYLRSNQKVASIKYPSLEGDAFYETAKKYLPNGSSGVISFELKGGYDAAIKFMDSLSLAKIVVHVADARTGVLHPASSTHRQLTEQQMNDAGINPGLIRLSVGIEDAGDIINDLENGFSKI